MAKQPIQEDWRAACGFYRRPAAAPDAASLLKNGSRGLKTAIRMLFAVVALFPASAALAQIPYLVRDINAAAGPTEAASSSPSEFMGAGGLVFFAATQPASGTELWVTDLTEGGTHLVRDIVPGSGSSGPHLLASLGNVLLFAATDSEHGRELWRSDGTEAGTSLLKDFTPGSAGGFITPGYGVPAITWHGRVYFTANDGTHGSELWATEGTSAGTFLVADIAAGPATSYPQSYVVLNDVLYFVASNMLYRTDGTSGGTKPVAQVTAGNLSVAGSNLFFIGKETATGYEPWVSDGTEAGTHLVRDVNPGSSGAWLTGDDEADFVPLGNSVLFTANDGVHGRERWRSDGTMEGTYLIADQTPGIASNPIPGGIVLDERFYFAGNNLWQTDGTVSGTVPVLMDGLRFAFLPILTYHDRLIGTLLVRGEPNRVVALEVVGTAARVTDVLPAEAAGMRVVDSRLMVRGIDLLRGIEPAVSDGTAAGTRIVANIAPEGVPSSNPRSLTAAGRQLFFNATDETGQFLHVSDGTSEGTRPLPAHLYSYSSDFAPYRNLLFYMAKDGLWLTDGTLPGTHAIPLIGSPGVIRLVSGTDGVYLSTLVDFRQRLWRNDGTGNTPVAANFDSLDLLAEIGGRIYLHESNTRLWVMNGSTPRLLANQLYSASFFGSGGRLFAFAGDGSGGIDLWRSDGSLDGTIRIGANVAAFPYPWDSAGRAADMNGKLLFSGYDQQHGEELWISDGTAAGTKLLVEIRSGTAGASPADLQALNGLVVFTADDGTHGREPWVSDGTAEGTRILRDLAPGAASSEPASFSAAAAGRIWFRANDGLVGAEPWTSDGTPEGTALVADVNPGTASSSAAAFTPAGGRLFFSATRAAEGNELWALPIANRLRISDTHVGEGDDAAIARLRVSLDAPSSTTITVAYTTADAEARAGSDYIAGSGMLTFEPGQTEKEIAVTVVGDSILEPIERFSMELHDATGAAIDRHRGWIAIDDDDAVADLEITQALYAATQDVHQYVYTVTNKGPLATTGVSIHFTQSPSQQASVGPAGTSTLETFSLQPGESKSVIRYFSAALATYRIGATVTGPLRDLNPSNNSAISFLSPLNGSSSSGLAFLARELIGDVPAALKLVGLNGRIVRLASSNPQLVAVPETVNVTTASFDVPLRVASGSGGMISISATWLNPGETGVVLSLPMVPSVSRPLAGSSVALSSEQPVFGSTLHWTARILGSGPNAAVPSGTVTFYLGGNAVATETLSGASATVPAPMLAPGHYTLRADYSGDDSFLASAADGSLQIAKAAPSFSLSAVKGHVGPLIIIVTGVGGKTPTGTVVVKNSSSLAQIASGTLAPVAEGIAMVTIASVPTLSAVRVSYGGDEFYDSLFEVFKTVSAEKTRSIRH
jgi:ELWxxDGT repeat protein